MTSQMGSLPRPARSAPENARSVATGTVRSAMLTYLGQIVIQQEAATKGSCPRPPPRADCARGASALSWSGRNIPSVGPRRKSIRRGTAPAGAEPACEENRHGRKTVRPPRWGHLVRRQAGALGRGDAARALPRLALRELGVRGRARLWRRDLQMHRAFAAAEAIGRAARLRHPLLGRRNRRRQAVAAGKERPDRRLCAADLLARLGNDG